MTGETRNRNALRSQKLLKKAFSELLAEKPFDKITVTDITRRADLSRGTFYAHYESTSDLLKDMVNDIVAKLFSVVDTAATSDFFENPDPIIKLIGDYVKQEESLYRTLCGTSAADTFVTFMKQCIVNRVFEQVDTTRYGLNELDLRVSVTCVAGGIVDLYISWLRGEFGDATIDDVGESASRLIRSIKAGYVPMPKAEQA